MAPPMTNNTPGDLLFAGYACFMANERTEGSKMIKLERNDPFVILQVLAPDALVFILTPRGIGFISTTAVHFARWSNQAEERMG